MTKFDVFFQLDLAKKLQCNVTVSPEFDGYFKKYTVSGRKSGKLGVQIQKEYW